MDSSAAACTCPKLELNASAGDGRPSGATDVPSLRAALRALGRHRGRVPGRGVAASAAGGIGRMSMLCEGVEDEILPLLRATQDHVERGFPKLVLNSLTERQNF